MPFGFGDFVASVAQALTGDPNCSPALYNLNTALRMLGRQTEAVTFSWRWILENLSEGTAVYATASAAAVAAAAAMATTSTSGGTIERWIVNEPHVTEKLGFHGPVGVPCPSGLGVGKACGFATTSMNSAAKGGGWEGSLTIACVRWGDKYGPEYVERLALGVRHNLHRRYRFVCFTDDVDTLSGMVGVAARPLGGRCSEWRGWWHKAFLFSR